jgi:hypothetical protein
MIIMHCCKKEWQGEKEALDKKAPVLLCPSQISHRLVGDQTQAFVVEGRRLNAWSIFELNVNSVWAMLEVLFINFSRFNIQNT